MAHKQKKEEEKGHQDTVCLSCSLTGAKLSSVRSFCKESKKDTID